MRIKQRLAILSAAVLLAAAGLYSGVPDQAPAQGPKPLELQDILNWKSIGDAEVSPDGNWFIYRLMPVEGDSETVIRQIKGTKEYRFPSGEVTRGMSSVSSFSADSGWAAFLTYPSMKEARNLRKDKKRITSNAVLVNLASGEKTEFETIRSFSFSGENPLFVVFHKYAPESREKEKNKWSGSDLIIRELKSSLDTAIGNVSEFAFNKKGERLALAVDAQGRTGNGILVRDMKTGILTPMVSDKAVFKNLNWTEKGDALAALKGRENKDYEDNLWSLIGFHGFGSAKGPVKIEYDPSTDKSFPEAMTLSPDRKPRWSDSLQAVFFGIKELRKKEGEAKKPEPSEDIPDLVVWNWKDPRLQSQQQVEANRDSTYSYMSLYQVKEKRFIRLADDSLRDIMPVEKDEFAIGLDNSPYELDSNLDGRNYRDVYVIDLKTGQKYQALKKCRWYFGTSYDGLHFLYYEDGHFNAYDMRTRTALNLTRDLPVSFINTEDDHNVTDPPRMPVGWTADGKRVLLSDGWDAWLVHADGRGQAVNLTQDGGRNGIRYQHPFRLDPEEKGIDLAKPVYFRIYGEWTKKSGIAVIEKGRPGARRIAWDDAAYTTLLKARRAPVLVFTRQTGKDFPDFYAADLNLNAPVRITEANPQQKNFLWSDGELLLDYVSDKGDKLQAALFLPAGYQKGKSYPTIVYIYEKLSQGLNSYTMPNPYGFNKSVYTSHGYAVLMPDIKYQIDDPGMSAVWCVLPALKAAVATGIVDPDRVGLHGHSWGGYQTAFLVTQTGAFAAAVAGAPLTNMISMYSSIYWNSGSANQPIFESSQGRFTGGYWQNLEAYARNSPVYYATRVETPLLILHNDKDGAVDWNQGIEYYNTLRRLKKPVVMLQYVGENHGLRKPANRKDYGIRMKEFFDHHLKGAPAPGWYKEGISHLKLKDHLKESAARIKLVEKEEKKPEEKKK